MKHLCLNLKRFDVPAAVGGVNRLADGGAGPRPSYPRREGRAGDSTADRPASPCTSRKPM